MKKKAEKLIRELVPKLQELKAGCRFVYNNVEFTLSTIGVKGGYAHSRHKTIQFSRSEINTCVILGQKIHLQHIILANRINQDAIAVMNYNEHNIVCKYNVCKSFTEQSEEFYKFLVEILK